MNFRKMARTKQTARKTGGALRTQAVQRAAFQWSSESDKDLPTSPLRGKKRSSSKSPARAPAKKSAAKSSPARSSKKKSPARAKPPKRQRGAPDPSSPVAGDPNRGSYASTKKREPKKANPPRKTGLPDAGVAARQPGATFTGTATGNNRRRRHRRHYVPPPLRRDEQGNVLRKRKRGSVALKEIRYYQKDDQPIIPYRPFVRLIWELSEDCKTGLRWQAKAIQALQDAAEKLIVELMELSVCAAIHARRVTIFPKDMQLVRRCADAKFPWCVTTRRHTN